MVEDDQHRRAHRHPSSLLAAPSYPTPVLRGPTDILAVARRPSRLGQGSLLPAIAGRDEPSLPFPRTILVARAHSRPTSQVPVGGKRAPASAKTTSTTRRSRPAHRLQALALSRQRARPLLDSGLPFGHQLRRRGRRHLKRWCSRPSSALSSCGILPRRFRGARSASRTGSSWQSLEPGAAPDVTGDCRRLASSFFTGAALGFHQLRSGPGQVAPLALRRKEAALPQPLRQQGCDPRAVADVARAPRHLSQVMGIHPPHPEAAFQDVGDRFPVPSVASRATWLTPGAALPSAIANRFVPPGRVGWCKLPWASIRRTPTSTDSLWKPEEKCSPPSAPFFRKPSAPRVLAWARRHCGVGAMWCGLPAPKRNDLSPAQKHKFILRVFSCCRVSQSAVANCFETTVSLHQALRLGLSASRMNISSDNSTCGSETVSPSFIRSRPYATRSGEL